MMQALVRKMAKRLADRYSRRRHKANRGHLDVRKTLRRSVAYGGVPFQIAWKIKKVDKPSIVAICDVSKSVAAAAQFLLTFLYSLNDVVDHLDAYAFSGRLIPVNDILDDNGVEGAILKVLQTIGFQQTDYGKALEDFVENHIDKVDRHTTVIFHRGRPLQLRRPAPRPDAPDPAAGPRGDLAQSRTRELLGPGRQRHVSLRALHPRGQAVQHPGPARTHHRRRAPDLRSALDAGSALPKSYCYKRIILGTSLNAPSGRLEKEL